MESPLAMEKEFLDAIASLECGYESKWVWFSQTMNIHWNIAKHGAIHTECLLNVLNL